MAEWHVPVKHKYKVTSDALDHLARSELCGIDFVTLAGGQDLLSMADGYVQWVHFMGASPGNYDTLGNFVAILFRAGTIPIFGRFAHNDDIRVSSAQQVKCGDVIGKYGNTGFSNGAHVHVDFWVHTKDIETARAMGCHAADVPFVRNPWPYAPLLVNVDATPFLQARGLDVVRTRG
jgi:murein DD-endopeptidase MepM/ murein hydrolase activator NlpD